MASLKTAAIIAACSLSAACASTPTEAPPTPPPSTTPDKSAVAWVNGYCDAVKDLTLEVYTLPKGFDIKTEADLPEAAEALQSLDTKLGTAITGLENLPQPPAQEANAIAAHRLAFYRDLRGQVTEYRTLLPRGGVDYAQSALTLLGVDLVSYKPPASITDVPGLREAKDADKDCELVS